MADLHPDIQAVIDGESQYTIVTGDCLSVLPTLPDGAVDCVVTDPPYGIGAANGGGVPTSAPVRRYEGDWDDSPPSPEFFREMRRVSREQVVFGGNHLATWLGSSPSWIVWDKNNGDVAFADCELAWTSHDRAVRKVRWRWHGMLQEHAGKWKEDRVHPTQKPTGLMLWVVRNYTPEGAVILDPYCGSGTTGVAALKLGRRFIGIELDPRYADIARRRCAEAASHLWSGGGNGG